MNEEFKVIKGFSNYSITKKGIVKNNKTEKILKPCLSSGYLCLTLVTDEKRKIFTSVHRLILLAYDYNENHEKLKVNHKDGDKLNNSVENLEWCTSKENTHHAIKSGLYNDNRSAISDETVLAIRKEFIPGQKGNRLALMKKYDVKKSMFYYIIKDEFRNDLPLTMEVNPYFNGEITTQPKMGRKLTDSDDIVILLLKKEGKTLAEIAKQFNVSPQAISAIIKRKTTN